MIERNQGTAQPQLNEHVVRFYDDETALTDQIWDFIGPALLAGGPTVVIATAARLEKIERKFAQHGWPGSAPPNLYVGMNAAQTLAEIMVDGWPDEKRFAEVVGDTIARMSRYGEQRVRAYGEMVALLCADEKPEAAIRLEQLWNGLVERHPFSLLCAYPIGAFSKGELAVPFQHVCDAHTHVLPAESFPAPANGETLHRTVAALQQKAAALESEIARRKQIESMLQRREKELSDFLENAVEGIHRVAADGRILWANKAALDLLGRAYDEYVGHHVAEFHVDREAVDDLMQRLLNGETVCDYPTRLKHKDGSIRHILVHSNACVTEGELVSAYCFMRDVTDRVALEEALQQKLLELAEMDRRKDEFLAMLGHELRNPLAPITTSLELMRIYADNPAQAVRQREVIGRQVALMTRLVDDLLDVSRITRGKIELKPETVALDGVVERAVEIVRPLLDDRRHHLALNLPTEPVSFYADPARLSQVLANLLHNAAKYTDSGGCIALSAREHDGELVLKVSDNGIGLDHDLCSKAFDLFVQGESTKTRGGLGLGLTLVRDLVRLHGGEVAAHSEGPGRGSEFVVTLPLRTAPATAALQPGNACAAERFPSSRRILIVDDNIDAAESLAEFLKAVGHRVLVAGDGMGAIEAAMRFHPEAVILDIGMPEMDGYQVARRLRSELGAPSPLLIAVSGYAQEGDRISARRAGFDHHFAKPLDMSRLAALLNGMRQAAGDPSLRRKTDDKAAGCG